MRTMECHARENLMRLLRTTTHDLAWAVEEECRLLFEQNLSELPELNARISELLERRRDAISSYRRHVLEHGCLRAG